MKKQLLTDTSVEFLMIKAHFHGKRQINQTYLAKNVVASKIANKCLIQLAYAIGVSKPLSIYVDLFDNDDEKNKHVEKIIHENFDLSPRGIREMLGLNKPIYEKTAAYGHFGRIPDEQGSFSWEKTDKSDLFNR